MEPKYSLDELQETFLHKFNSIHTELFKLKFFVEVMGFNDTTRIACILLKQKLSNEREAFNARTQKIKDYYNNNAFLNYSSDHLQRLDCIENDLNSHCEGIDADISNFINEHSQINSKS